MPSVARSSWETSRAARLDELQEVHVSDETSDGELTPSEVAVWSMLLILSAEFQGFARDLHDEAVEFLASAISRGDEEYYRIVRNNLTANRELDSANAKPSSIGNDFKRLGMSDIWESIEKSSPDGAQWRSQLGILTKARNVLAHGNPAGLSGLSGVTVDIETVKKWRISCNGISREMDILVKDHLNATTGREPW